MTFKKTHPLLIKTLYAHLQLYKYMLIFIYMYIRMLNCFVDKLLEIIKDFKLMITFTYFHAFSQIF